MLLKETLKESLVRINKVHPESTGYFSHGSTGSIHFIESDGAVWVNFNKGQAGVKETGYSLYIGDLNDCDELFEILEE